MVFLFSLTLFLASFLLFSVQPMVGKFLLPILGGVPAVWNTCLVFFQLALLLGYLYAHFLALKTTSGNFSFRSKWLDWLHIGLLISIALILPLSFGNAASDQGQVHQPITWLLSWLTLNLGAQFVILSATAPLLQTWFLRINHKRSSDPYFLYVASNLGSLAGLLFYPVVIERFLSLADQRLYWSYGFIMLGLLLAICRWQSGSAVQQEKISPTLKNSIPSTWSCCYWLLLAFVPTSLMIGMTTHISTNIAAVPMLWVLPLAIYLLTFIITFQSKPLIAHSFVIRWTPFALIILLPFVILEIKNLGWLAVPLQLFLLTVVSLFAHAELAKRRPAPEYLTHFYLIISCGGVLAGFFNAILAPLIFNSIIEYPLTMIVAILLLVGVNTDKVRSHILRSDLQIIIVATLISSLGVLVGILKVWEFSALLFLFVYGVPAIFLYALRKNSRLFSISLSYVFIMLIIYASYDKHQVILSERNFYGLKKIIYDPERKIRSMVHGSTSHGCQSIEASRLSEPLCYYHSSGPVGDVFRVLDKTLPAANLGIIGLGVGAMSAYLRPSDRATFFELDPLVQQIAQESKLFTFIKDSKANITTIIGDGRLTIQEVPDQELDLLFLDAFSSDAVPVHLLTHEALELYFSKIRANGMIVFHVSNQYLDLASVLARDLKPLGLIGLIRRDHIITPEEEQSGKLPSEYVVITRTGNPLFQELSLLPNWKKLEPSSGPAWRDDFSDLVSVLNFSN